MKQFNNVTMKRKLFHDHFPQHAGVPLKREIGSKDILPCFHRCVEGDSLGHSGGKTEDKGRKRRIIKKNGFAPGSIIDQRPGNSLAGVSGKRIWRDAIVSIDRQFYRAVWQLVRINI
jgi:hypothetical protein